jgi:hypothetical protein
MSICSYVHIYACIYAIYACISMNVHMYMYKSVYVYICTYLSALIETLFDYCPREGRNQYPSTAQIGTKLLYMPSPNPVVYVVPLSHILGRLPLIPSGDFSTIPRNMSGRGDGCYPQGSGDKRGAPGSGSKLFYINSWAMIWPTDYPAGGR